MTDSNETCARNRGNIKVSRNPGQLHSPVAPSSNTVLRIKRRLGSGKCVGCAPQGRDGGLAKVGQRDRRSGHYLSTGDKPLRTMRVSHTVALWQEASSRI